MSFALAPTTSLRDDRDVSDAAAFDARTRAVAAWCRARGLHKGDRLVLVTKSSLAAVQVLWGAWRAGVVVVPANPSYQHAELSHVVQDSGARIVVADGPDASAVRAALADDNDIAIVDARAVVDARAAGDDLDDLDGLDDVDARDLALLIYTSGTTGRSKGCAHTHGGLRAGIGALMTLWGVGPSDVVINPLPLFHVHGLCVCLLGALWQGARVCLVPHFSAAAVVDAIDAHGGTVLMTVPTMVHRLLAALDDDGDSDSDSARHAVHARAVLARLRLATCGSAALSQAQLERFRAHTGLTLLERYGMSETLITLSNPLVGERRPGAVGWPVPGTTMCVVDDELWVAGAGMMQGYWNRADADADAFVVNNGVRYFRTGDVVDVAADGCVRIVGRASQDIVKVGGFKISTREIEEQLERHPAVAEVCVVGVPDDEWGEQIVAVVVLRNGASLSLAEAQDATALAAVKKPRRLVVVDALPRNGMGKVMKPAVRARVHANDAAR